MPAININENDNSSFGLTTATSDNVVYIPGSAITGRFDEPVLCSSRKEFIDNFGASGCEGSSTFEYVTNLISAGFPVLFKRIGQKNELSSNPTSLLTKATFVAKLPDSAESKDAISFTEKYGGSYGNSLKVALNQEGSNIVLRIYYGNSNIESFRVATVANVDTAESKKAILDGLRSIESSKIDIAILLEDESEYVFSSISKESLSGGKDADETEVLNEIAQSTFELSPFSIVRDKYVYDLKFIASGGYIDSNNVIASMMNTLAMERGDCTAFPDIPEGTPRENVAKYFSKIDTTYSAAYAPWGYVKLSSGSKEWMPPSFIFLTALASSLSSNNPIWYAPAGVKRMICPKVLKTEYEIGGSTLSEWQDGEQCINPIMKIRGYGYAIYGQRTLHISDQLSNNETALQQLHIRFIVNEIKKRVFNVCISLTFEANMDRTWNEFRSGVEPLLANMKSDRGLSDYRIIMDRSTISDEDLRNRKIKGIIKVSAIDATEDFDIDFSLSPSSVTFDSEDNASEI